MKTTLLRLSRSAACLVLAGALLTGCSLLPAASPRADTSSYGSMLYDSTKLEDGRLRIVYSYQGAGGGTLLRGGTVLYEGSAADSVQLVPDTLTGETHYYLIAHSDPGTEDRTTTLYDADGKEVFTFDRAVSASISGGLLIVTNAGEIWAFEGDAGPGGLEIYDLNTKQQLPVPEDAIGCMVADDAGQALVFNCYTLPEGIQHSYDDPEQPLHQYVLITDRAGNELLREEGCSANTLYSGSGISLPDWVQFCWYTADWSTQSEALYNTATGQRINSTAEGDVITACGGGYVSAKAEDGSYLLYDLNGDEPVELGRFNAPVASYTPGCVMLLGGDCATDDASYTLIDLASGEQFAVQRSDYSYTTGDLAVLTSDNTLKVYDGTTGALLTDVDVTPIAGASYISVTTLNNGYVLLQHDDENYDTIAMQTYGTEGLLWDSSADSQQYGYASYLTNTENGPLLSASTVSSDGTSLYDVLDMTGKVLLHNLGSCYVPDNNYPDDYFIARQGFYYGLMDSTGQWLYCESIFSSPSDDAGGSYLY